VSPFTDEERTSLVLTAHQQLAAGAYERAMRILATVLHNDGQSVPQDDLTFVTLRMLGQSARTIGDLGTATSAYQDAQRLALALERPDLESAAVAGLAFVASAGDDLELALDLNDRAAQLARDGGDERGRSLVLGNNADVLMRLERLAEAEAHLGEALECDELLPGERAKIEDSLAVVLNQRDRPEEALAIAQRAVEDFRAAGMRHDLRICLSNLEGYQRRLGYEEEAAKTFVEAHELMRELAEAAVDRDHYAGFEARAQEVEEETRKRVESEGEGGGWVIGVNAMLGEQLLAEGNEAYEQGDYARGEQALLSALAHWERLGAAHVLPRVHLTLGVLYSDAGQGQQAVQHLLLARRSAFAIGDASREFLACMNLSRLAGRSSVRFNELDRLELIARARALRPIATHQRFGLSLEGEEPLQDAPLDGGVIDTLDANDFTEHGAYEEAEQALRRAVALAEAETEDDGAEGEAPVWPRLTWRLVSLYSLLRRQEKDEEADAVRRRLDELARIDTTPRSAFLMNREFGAELFNRGEWTAEAFGRLVAACDAYERLRRKALEVGDLDEFGEVLQPPFDEAIEVALELGLDVEGLHLLERSKARSLLEALRGVRDALPGDGELAEEARLWHELQEAHAEFDHRSADESPDDRARRLYDARQRIGELEPRLDAIWESLGSSHPDLVVHRLGRPATVPQIAAVLAARDDDALVIELFVGPRTIRAFALDAQERLEVHRLGEAGDGSWAELATLVHGSTEKGGAMALEAIFHPALREFSRLVDALAGDRPVVLVPHQFLHALPLHLREDEGGAPAPRPRSFQLPSASLLVYARPHDVSATESLVAGDPLGDLPFASLEARTVASRFETDAGIGVECTPDWLAGHLVPREAPWRLVHLACHAVFHARRAERSGLILAENGEARAVDVDWLAMRDWSSELVMLSACSSGQQQVRDGDELAGMARTLLARGARALIVALWEVPDLTTFLLVTRLYEGLPAGEPWTVGDIGLALARAQISIRDYTARELVALACELHAGQGLGHEPGGLQCAMAAAAQAHLAAGNHAEWLRWHEAIRASVTGKPVPADIGAPDWSVQHSIAHDDAYAAAPFADPLHWGAFALFGAG
jgi:CHAT domain-containing protein/tetratricopeptide (TPR) repeat protein